MNAASERSFQMNEKARQQRSRAENLTNMATTNKGDAAKRRAARAEQVKASYGGIKKGTIVEPIMGLGGAATVIRANAKSVTMKMSDGSIMKEPYERLKLKSPTLGSSKVVDNAKVNRMADRLGAKSRAPKSGSPVKNANTVAVRAKAVAFLKGKGGTFPNSSSAIAAMAANIRNRPRFSTGSAKPAIPQPTNAARPKVNLSTSAFEKRAKDAGARASFASNAVKALDRSNPNNRKAFAKAGALQMASDRYSSILRKSKNSEFTTAEVFKGINRRYSTAPKLSPSEKAFRTKAANKAKTLEKNIKAQEQARRYGR